MRQRAQGQNCSRLVPQTDMMAAVVNVFHERGIECRFKRAVPAKVDPPRSAHPARPGAHDVHGIGKMRGSRHLASEAVYLNGERLRPTVDRFLWHCDELRGYLADNETALIDYGARYRTNTPISSSRTEGCVD
jgi:hypothetical protein